MDARAESARTSAAVAVQMDYVPSGANRSRLANAQAQFVPGAAWLLRIESTLPLVILITLLVITNIRSVPYGLDAFLSTRITVKNVLLCALFVTGWSVILRLFRVYDRRAVQDAKAEVIRVVGACTVGCALGWVFPLTSVSGAVDAKVAWLCGLVSTLVVLGIRAIRRIVGSRRVPKRVIVIGTGARALRVAQELAADGAGGCELVGFVDSDEAVAASVDIERRRLGTFVQLERVLMQESVDEVFITLPVKSHYREIQDTIAICERVGVKTKYQADMFSTSLAWPCIEAGSTPVVTMHVTANDYRLAVKRVIDVVAALVGLIVLAPVMLVTAIAIKLTSPGPILFKQERHGLNKRSFTMLKFRTMVADAAELQKDLERFNQVDGPVFKLFDDPRVTPVGRILRKTSIDELPQLFNVLKGEMSLVGPRPLPLRDVQRFTRASDMRRFSVRPGLTCLWQISGRSQLQFSEWVRLDLRYIDGWSLTEDVRILAKTIPAVLRGTGAR
jgi:exopolysaccharide biosynthesis polyprenyl glycosylphosphotransferase